MNESPHRYILFRCTRGIISGCTRGIISDCTRGIISDCTRGIISGSTTNGPEPQCSLAEPTIETSRTQASVSAESGLHLSGHLVHGGHGLRGGPNDLHVVHAGRPRPHRFTSKGAVAPTVNHPASTRCRWRGQMLERNGCCGLRCVEVQRVLW